MKEVEYLEFLERQFAGESTGDYQLHQEPSVERPSAPVGMAADWLSLARGTTPRTKIGFVFGVSQKDLVNAALRLSGLPFRSAKTIFKRSIDLLLSLMLLVLFLPLILCVGVAIRLDSPGPVLYYQTRVGMRGATFRMFKFRTMVIDDGDALAATIADGSGASGPLFKLRRDPRVTRVGRVLRRYSIDELPQLVNVLRGDMSLVGPRPALPAEVNVYDLDARRRLMIRPGITGLWQISGRSNLAWEEAIRLDLNYIENWTPTLDAMVLWRTVKVVVTGG